MMLPTPNRPAIALKNLSVGHRVGRRHSKTILGGIEASLMPGQFTFLLGPNGAGKSTLLRTIVGSQKALGGTVMLDGHDLARLSARERARRLSVVLTDRVDVGLMSVRSLVALGRAPYSGLLARNGRDDAAIIDWAIAASGATNLANRMVHELSDGERQRAMIARALAQQPSILVLDEPTAFLDLTRRVEMTALLNGLVRQTGLAVLMSTHDLDLALRLADQVWLVHGDGRFDTGAPEDLALSGAIGRAYAGKGMEFDHSSGTFTIDAPKQGLQIALRAEGPHRDWAERALVRAGCQPRSQDCACPGQLVIPIGDGPATWRLAIGNFTSAGTGFAALHAALTQYRQETLSTKD